VPRAKNDPDTKTISIRGDLTIDRVSEIRDEMRSALPAKDLTLDLSQLEKIDLAGLQLLYSLERSVLAEEGTMRVNGDSARDRLIRMVSFTGLRTPTFLESPREQ